MDMQSNLRETVAEFFQVAPDQVADGFDLHGLLTGSLARARFDVAIRQRLKIICPQVYSAQTYGELEAAVLGKPFLAANGVAPAALPDSPRRAAPATTVIGSGPASENVACGIDLESP